MNAVVDFYARALEESHANFSEYDMEGTVKHMGNNMNETGSTTKTLAPSASIPIITAQSNGIQSMAER